MDWTKSYRALLAGPFAVILAVLVLAGSPLWFPPGPANVDHIVLPLIALPGVWAILFFHALLDRSLMRVTLIGLTLAVLNVWLLVRHFQGTS